MKASAVEHLLDLFMASMLSFYAMRGKKKKTGKYPGA